MTTSTAVSLLYPHRGGDLVADDTRGFEEGRQYHWAGTWLDSVTSIISQGVPKGEAITKWAARETAQYAVRNADRWVDPAPNDEALGDWTDSNGWRDMPFDVAEKVIKAAPFQKRDDAAELGSSVHDYAEAMVLGQPLPVLDEVGQKKAALFRSWLDDYKPKFEAAECWVYNMGRRYAGRLDAIAHIDGVGLTLIDYKTGKNAYPEVGLQLAALRNCEFVGLADGTEVPMPQVAACAVLHIQLRQYKFQFVRADDVDFRAFLYAQQVAEWRKKSNGVIGGHVPPPPKFPPRPNAPVNPAAFLD